MKYLSKIIFLFVFFSLTPSFVKANVCVEGRDPGTCQGTWLTDEDRFVDISYCNLPSVSTCAKGDECPYKTCLYFDNGCCSDAQDWTAYKTACVKREVIPYMPSYITVYVKIKTVYSIGDKADASSSYLFDKSTCEGQAIAPYKACCNTSTKTLVPYITDDYDGSPPLEAGCPSGSSVIWNGGLTIDLNWAQVTCNPCQNDCLTPPSTGTCSGLNSSTYVYTSGTGLCAAGQICCSKTAVVPTPTSTQPACTMDSQCEDNNMCTSNICKNPGTASAKCDFPLNTLCVRYYCNNTSHTCSATSNTYNADAAGTALCQSNLGTIYPGQTTGVCYPKESDCISVCSVGPTTTTTTTTTQCVPFNCTRRDGDCGGDNGVTFSSTSGKPTRLCKEGTPTEPTVINGNWAWECIGDGSNP